MIFMRFRGPQALNDTYEKQAVRGGALLLTRHPMKSVCPACPELLGERPSGGVRSIPARPERTSLHSPPQTTGAAPASSPARAAGGATDCKLCLSAPPGAGSPGPLLR